MKHLYLIRHAKSSWDYPHLSDFDRPLNKRGEKDAPLMGNVLVKENVDPDLIISSPAKRAITTAKVIASSIGYQLEIEENRNIYGADTQLMLNLVNGVSQEVNTLMLFGHNPTFTYFAEMLSGADIGNLPTTGVVGIEFDFDNWELVSSGTGTCFYYDYPKKHK